MTKPRIVIYWIRRDFRLLDNPALSLSIEYAKEHKLPHLGVFVLDDDYLNNIQNNVGRNRRFFLAKLIDRYLPQFVNFRLYRGSSENVFAKLSNGFELQVFANDDIEPYAIQRDAKVKALLEKSGGRLNLYNDQITVNRDISPSSGSSKFYSVFTPYKNAVRDEFINAMVTDVVTKEHLQQIPQLDPGISVILRKLDLSEINGQNGLFERVFSLLDKPNILYLAGGRLSLNIDELIKSDLQNVQNFWYFDETEALSRFDRFVDNKILDYKAKRDDLELDTLNDGQTSQMSAALKWGMVSARTLKRRMAQKYGTDKLYSDEGLSHYISELIWREFYKYTLYHYPQGLYLEFNPKFRQNIDWIDEPIALERLKKWITGRTGYPIVDAAMHQIASVGWMHNRSRMIVASVLSKNLSVDWRWGQEYFRVMLCDMDEAANNGGWQWAASTGTDPKPIRIFNPYLQAENYDKHGLYRKKWLPNDYFINPPHVIIEHKLAREEALKRYRLQPSKGVRDF